MKVLNAQIVYKFSEIMELDPQDLVFMVEP